MAIFDRFPEPIGEYIVGRRHIDITYTNMDVDERALSALVFYPSDSSEGKEPAPYAPKELMAFRNELMHKLGAPPDDLVFDPAFGTRCYEDIALSEKEERFPVLIYSHGAATAPHIGTWICQDMASRGYLVVAVGHAGSGIFPFRDGRFSALSPEFVEGTVRYAEETLALMMPELPGLMTEKLDRDKAIALSRRLTGAPEAVRFGRFARMQCEDIMTAADVMFDMDSDEEALLYGRLLLSGGLGVFGHSLGGTAATLASRRDSRFACAVNLDGNMVGALDIDTGKPYLQLGTVLSYNTNAFLLETNRAETTLTVIDGAAHGDFADSLFTSASRTGSDAMELRARITGTAGAFFDRIVRARTQ